MPPLDELELDDEEDELELEEEDELELDELELLDELLEDELELDGGVSSAPQALSSAAEPTSIRLLTSRRLRQRKGVLSNMIFSTQSIALLAQSKLNCIL